MVSCALFCIIPRCPIPKNKLSQLLRGLNTMVRSKQRQIKYCYVFDRFGIFSPPSCIPITDDPLPAKIEALSPPLLNPEY